MSPTIMIYTDDISGRLSCLESFYSLTFCPKGKLCWTQTQGLSSQEQEEVKTRKAVCLQIKDSVKETYIWFLNIYVMKYH